MEEIRQTHEKRPRLVDDVEALAERASSIGAVRRANDLRAIAEHLRAKEARGSEAEGVGTAGAGRGTWSGRLRRVLSRVRTVFTRSSRR